MTSNKKIDTAKTPLKEIGLGFFIPIYFAVVGLKLDLIHYFNLPFFLAFLLFAVAIKTLGTVTAARLARQDWLSSFNLSVAMNARGGHTRLSRVGKRTKRGLLTKPLQSPKETRPH